MAIRSNHYDAAFEGWLRAQRRPYVAVDESRRALLAQASLKSFDFIVYSSESPNVLLDVKGRRFPSADADQGHLWENWATRDDVTSLLRWQEVFGAGFRAALVFAYELRDERWRGRHDMYWTFRGRDYSFYLVWVDEFAAEMTNRSPRWETVTLPAAAYRRLRRPLAQVLSDTTGTSAISPAWGQVAAC
jgi:hypothetical protein